MDILIIALILNLIGRVLKKLKFIKNNYIPVILTVCGCLLCLGYYAIFKHTIDWNTILVNGMLASTSSVYIYEILKQIIELLPLNNEAKKVIKDVVEQLPKEK